jgi:hypothetical protein
LIQRFSLKTSKSYDIVRYRTIVRFRGFLTKKYRMIARYRTIKQVGHGHGHKQVGIGHVHEIYAFYAFIR